MNVFQVRDKLKQRLAHLNVDFKFDREEETLRIYRQDNHKGVTIKLNAIVAKYEVQKEKIIDEIVYYVEEAIAQMDDQSIEKMNDIQIMPVIRATSFDKKNKDGHPFIIEKHTAETNIYYALDLGKSYRLIDESMLESLGLTEQQVKEMSLFNIRKLNNQYKTDEVKGNIFYFVNSNDGYDASRVLNTKFLDDIYQQCEGEMLVAVPHQDVLIIADIRNKTGYDVMAHLTMEFFTKGLVPITSLSFGYEKGHFEPIFILGKNNKQKRDPNVIQRLEANRKKFNNKK
ncbi:MULTISPECIES: DUF1444 domain-containing protein [unclassified Staphylococcus]|uniref:DUF1444 domain-containing protein n=1 Tax=unclassified Staphylococcus TaxID=91994 RepID=UPI00187FB1F7|nr:MULTISPECIES: DUF1444 domain-containing protein [unclassified Staphylococcus]MBF2757711.1 DUF1444 domain-containing protein [Staphylococcus haemolyticus]MBF2773329.1 DUF1444 domain-containing protein [Staphylococcus haemolyticus]MBF2776908.1 DUF1444 domain-containing protein [Staphylococcus haemolyticus]MBF2815161.1 DUF1444 domain-containing protein [Staphylococcus haemolyticus]MBF9721321.1 DUF1444 domain-containing protein [Staphylococcus haemolyticus]